MNVAVGSPLPEWTLASVRPDRMKLLAAILRDPNPIHWDPLEVERRGLGRRTINQGPTNLGYVINMLIAWAGPESIRHIVARFTSNVFSGDTVIAGGVVTAIRDQDGERLVDCDVWLDRGDGTRALAGTVTVAVADRGGVEGLLAT
jgi:acyl dehydratase